MSKLDVEAVRKDFPILNQIVNDEPLVYLDNAAMTQKPRQVLEAVFNEGSSFYERCDDWPQLGSELCRKCVTARR